MNALTSLARRAPMAVAAAGLFALARPAGAQDTHLLGFADVQFRASDQTGDHPAFSLGQLVSHFRSRLTDRLSFMSETVFESEGPEFVVDIERVILAYRASDHFRFDLGKLHTPLGAWNNKYHHGTLLQPTITRPLLVQFEDDGGILPVHTLGLQFGGHDFGSAHLGYDVMVGNGTGATAESDNNNAKSLTATVYAQPSSRLRAGVSAYADRLAAGTATRRGDSLSAPMTQAMVGAFGVYEGPAVVIHAELMSISNRQSGTTTSTLGYFAYAGYRRDKWVPYGLMEEVRYPASDPFFAVDDYRQAILGVRYDIAAAAVLKVEYRNRRTASAGSVNEFAAQMAVGF